MGHWPAGIISNTIAGVPVWSVFCGDDTLPGDCVLLQHTGTARRMWGVVGERWSGVR